MLDNNTENSELNEQSNDTLNGYTNEYIYIPKDAPLIKSNPNYSKAVDFFGKISQNIKSRVINRINDTSDKANEIICSIRKDKLKNVESILKIDRSQLIVSSKRNYIYKTESNKMYIIDRDMWGDPINVTIKDASNVSVKTIKYLENTAILFPVFDEKNIMGKILFMEQNEIWYQNNEDIAIVLFTGENADFIKFKLKNAKNLDSATLMNQIYIYKTLECNSKLKELILNDKKINIENIVKLNNNFAIIKNDIEGYNILMYDYSAKVSDELYMTKLPFVDDKALEVLFSKDIIKYIKANNYALEKFKQNEDHIEYWKEIGDKSFCVMRCKI